MVEMLRNGIYLEKASYWDCTLEGDIGTQVDFSLLPGHHEVSSFIPPHIPFCDVLPLQKPKVIWSSDHV
jgi:hypothetical protein